MKGIHEIPKSFKSFLIIHDSTTLSTNKLFFSGNDGVDTTDGNPIPEVPLGHRQLVNDVSLRKNMEKYSGVKRYKTGEIEVISPTMTRDEFHRMLARLKGNNMRELSSFLESINEHGNDYIVSFF